MQFSSQVHVSYGSLIIYDTCAYVELQFSIVNIFSLNNLWHSVKNFKKVSLMMNVLYTHSKIFRGFF